MSFYDFDISMTRLSDGSIGIKSDRLAIVQAIKYVLLTRRGEKLFDPDYGGGIGDYTDGSINILDALAIKDEIYYAIRNELSELIIVNKNDIKVEANEEKIRYDITIYYRKNEISEKELVSFSLSVDI